MPAEEETRRRPRQVAVPVAERRRPAVSAEEAAMQWAQHREEGWAAVMRKRFRAAEAAKEEVAVTPGTPRRVAASEAAKRWSFQVV
jgi:hypothetical protein